ncbi:transmembrane protein, putative (macronuclear) [Tetrahymena thermophila SB210]|uniref:Transmembrane protein, putative n=1 Tax=Tetrahymena thermophila (strain SB210) TaxID=312017 RepID=Q22C31_TETTS|nr:transmembrane protein, putative [Tetrahymena thermophila SB210]EAR82831.2 transmembrane protein, putative [Tetrahymena thermophila SB210]|eukprot:XP_001030494.2 transmembrane protein, putative [Tetrahymena thermophila SB210]
MKLKYEMFIILSIPTFLMITLQFINAVIIYIVSQKLINEYTQNLYLDQQQQTKDIISAYSYEFSQIFQSFSMNLQMFVNFESKLLANQVKINPKYKQSAIFLEKLYSQDPSQQELLNIYKKSDLQVSVWLHPNISDFDKLDSTGQQQVKRAGYIDFIWRILDYQNRMDQFRRQIPVKDIYQGFFEEGILYSTSSNTTFQNYVLPQGCQLGGKYKFDSRCRIWFVEAIQRLGITPIAPVMFYSQVDKPFLATNLCQRQNIQSSTGKKQWKPYSVDCLNFKLSNLYSFFDEQTFDYSHTIMIDPRSQEIVYNQLQKFNNTVTNLSDAAQDIFPHSKKNSDRFLKFLQENINSIYNITAKQNNKPKHPPFHDQNNNQNIFDLIPPSVNISLYDDFIDRVSYISYGDIDLDDIHYFEFDTADGDDVFVVFSPIKIIEKLGNQQRHLKNQQDRVGFDIQDLFLVIDVLPKSYLTEFSDQLNKKMSIFFISYGIGSCVALVLFFAVCGFISLRVAIMIETPISHMILLLKKLEKEGSQVTLDLLDDSIQMPEDKIIVSLDSLILFESFKSMFKMLHYVTQDIFNVEESQSLLRLNQQVSFFKKFHNYRALGICYNNMGNIHFQSERYSEAMENYYHSIIYGYYELGFYKERKLSCSEQEQFIENISQNQLRISSSKCKSNSQNEVRGLNTFSEVNKNINNQQHQSLSTKVRNTNSSARNQNSGAENNQQDQNLYQQEDQKQFNQAILGQPEEEHQKDNKNTDEINQIIFDRKFNFTKAFNMLNFQLQKQGQSQSVLWEEYETMLLDLLNFNEKLKSISYGRMILLSTQLSLCYLQMNDHKRSIYYQKQAIKSYNDALEIESLAKKHSLKKNTCNSPRFGGHFRLDFSQEEDECDNDENKNINKEEKSINPQNKENSFLNNHLENELIDENVNNSFKKQNPTKNDNKSIVSKEYNRQQNTIDINQVMYQATKNMDEEISIDNLFKKRYSNAHNIQIEIDRLSNMNNNQLNKVKNNQKPFKEAQQNGDEEEEKQQLPLHNNNNQNQDEYNKSRSYNAHHFNNSGIENIEFKNNKKENNQNIQENSEQFNTNFSNEQFNQERDRLYSEHSNFQRKPRRSKYQQESFQGLDFEKSRRQSNDKCIKKKQNKNKLNNSFSINRNQTSYTQQSKRNSLKHFQQGHTLQVPSKQNTLCVTYSAGANQLSVNSVGQLNSAMKHALTLPTQHPENLIQQQNTFDYNHHRSNTSLTRKHANSASNQNQQKKNKTQSVNVNQYHIDLTRPRSLALQQLSQAQNKINEKNVANLSVIPSHQGTLNILTQDTSNNKITQNSLVANTFNNNINVRAQNHLIRCKDCSVYDDIASISSHVQQQNQQQQTYQQQLHSSNLQQNQMLIKKQKIKKKNLHLISKINKNLEENDGKKISKYQLPCNILLYYVGIQEAKILIFEKQYQSAAYLLTELLENVKYYLPYYRKQCLVLLNEIFQYSHVNIEKQLHDMIERFDCTIAFKVASIIAVNTAYSDAAKTCQHLIKEVLAKDEDLFSLIIFNSLILKQVMPPICMKQVKSASEYFDTLLNYISGDADSVEISSYSYEFNDEQHIANHSLQTNQNNQYINPSLVRSNTNHTYPTFTENNDLNFQTAQNDQQNLFTEKSHQDILQLLSPQSFVPTESDMFQFHPKHGSQRLILGGTEIESPRYSYNKFNMPFTLMAPIKESSKEINLIESNLMDTHKIITPLSALKSQSEVFSNRNQWIVSNTNIKIKNQESNKLLKNSIILENSENVENNENFTEQRQNFKEKEQQGTSSSRKKSLSLSLLKSSSQNQNQKSIFTLKSSENQQIQRKRNSSAPNNLSQQIPQILVNQQAQSQKNEEDQQILQDNSFKDSLYEQNNISNIKKQQTEIYENNQDQLRIQQNRNEFMNDEEILPTYNNNLYENKDSPHIDSQINLLQLQLNKKNQDNNHNLQQQNNENLQYKQSSLQYLIQKDIDQIDPNQDQNEENNNKLRSITLNNTHKPIIRSSFSKHEDIRKSKNSNNMLSQGTLLLSAQSIPNSLQSKQFQSLAEQDEEQIDTPLKNNQKRKKILEEQFKRVESKKYIETEEIHSYQSSLRQQQVNQDNYFYKFDRLDNEEQNINKSNINQVFHLSVRKALASFFENEITRYKQQIILTQDNVINKNKKFIVFITDFQGFKENKLYDLMAEELYKTQTQLLILQLDYEESIQENTQNQDVFYKGKSVIKYFYTQEKLLQYIRNKREPMKNFGIPLMMEHFQ